MIYLIRVLISTLYLIQRTQSSFTRLIEIAHFFFWIEWINLFDGNTVQCVGSQDNAERVAKKLQWLQCDFVIKSFNKSQ